MNETQLTVVGKHRFEKQACRCTRGAQHVDIQETDDMYREQKTGIKLWQNGLGKKQLCPTFINKRRSTGDCPF